MTLSLISPSKILLTNYSEKQLDLIRGQLTITDKRAEFLYRKAKKSHYLLNQMGEEKFKTHIARLKKDVHQCLLFESKEGFWTYSGLGKRLSKLFNDDIVREFTYPSPELLAWHKTPTKKLSDRPYQQEIIDALLEVKHGAVSVATGLGKSFCLINIIKKLALKTVVMAPSKSIAIQLFDELTQCFGTKNVGLYGDGKKISNKLITVAIAQSLVKVEKGSKAWNDLKSTQVFVADESHLTPAKTLENVCIDLLGDAPYRFFLSATQMRADGLELVLEGIVGPTVYQMSVRQGVEQRFLSPLIFNMVEVESDSHYQSSDINNMSRAHLLYNNKVNKLAGELANRFVESGRQVLVLVEEVEQFGKLLPYLNHKAEFAHGPLSKENKDSVPEAYQVSDPKKYVDLFNDGKISVLVGTSCVSTGTDLRPVGALIRIKGGKSEIEVRQDIGRGTRLPEGKTDCVVVDFDVVNVEDLHRHALDREQTYDDIYGPVNRINMV